MTRKTLFALACVAFLLPGCRPAPGPAPSDEAAATFRQALQGYVDDGRLAGSVTLVTHDGREVFHEAVGFRDRESGDPMTRDTIFRIASQTKAPVSVVTMMLEEEGRLELTDPVGKYLPGFMQTTVAVRDEDGSVRVVAADRPITIFDLLTHTAGVGYGSGGPAETFWALAGIRGWYFADRDQPMKVWVERMAEVPFDVQPGAAFVYGYSTDILGVVLETITGQGLDELLSERLFEPLDMRDTHFCLPADKRDRLAVVYSRVPAGIARAPEHGEAAQGAYVDGPCVAFSGGAGLLSTASDYTRFLRMLLEGGTLDGVRLLSPETVERMTRSHIREPDLSFGLGFSVLAQLQPGQPGSVGEYGWGGAYHTSYWVDPVERLTVVHLTQLIPAGEVDDHRAVRFLVYEELDVPAR